MDSKTLTKEWIKYLKGLQIVQLKSDPETGKLKYKRPVTVDDIDHFLEVKTDYDPEIIKQAVEKVLSKKNNPKQLGAPETQNKNKLGYDPNSISDIDYKEIPREKNKSVGSGNLPAPADSRGLSVPVSPQSAQVPQTRTNITARTNNKQKSAEFQPNAQIGGPKGLPAPPPREKKKYNIDDVSDIDFTEIPRGGPKRIQGPPVKSPEWKPRFRLRKVKEDITDGPSPELNESDVEQIFQLLAGGNFQQGKNLNLDQQNNQQGQNQSQQTPDDRENIENIRAIKKTIRDSMTPSQRKSLWRLLKDDGVLSEEQITDADAKEIFKVAAGQKTGNLIGFNKKTVNVSDLQQAWKDIDYSDELADIERILREHGFSKNTINKILSKVFGTKGFLGIGNADVTTNSSAVKELANYITKNGLTQNILKFLQTEYSMKESLYPQKLAVEDIRQIFTHIIREERTDREILIREFDKIRLGRVKK